MRGDFSRVTFRPDRHYSGVRLQQGRVLLDAEWNEREDIEVHRHTETAKDLIGSSGAPYDGGGFLVQIATRLRDVDVEGTTLWAVGKDALLLSLDTDGSWKMVQDPPAGTGDLNALRLTGTTSGLAVGDGGVLLRLTDSTWQSVALPVAVTANLYGVATAAGEAWAVGDRGTIVHRGTSGPWVVQSPPEGTTMALRGVHFANVDRGWAVGDGAVILTTHDGTTWTRQNAARGTSALNGVFALDDTHVWAVGDGATILFWNGTEWLRQQVPAEVGSLRAVCFQDASNGTVVGDYGIVLVTSDGGTTQWQRQALPSGSPHLHGLAIDTAGTAYAVGDDASFTRQVGVWSAGPALPAGMGRSLTISAGDLYVDGVRVVNEHLVGLTGQPDLTFNRPSETAREPVFPPATTPDTYGVYLEVFDEHLTALDREELREVALGGPDTATRTRTVWQAKLLALDDAANCESLAAKLPLQPSSDGRLRARGELEQPASSECSIAGNGGFRRLENQLYRVEIHESGSAPTFKWSRDNGMVAARLEAVEITPGVEPEPGSGSVTVSHPGRDEVVAFGPGQWIELNDVTREQRGQPGELVQVKEVRGNVLDLEPKSLPKEPKTMADFPVRPTVRRWDGRETVKVGPWHKLEDGVEVQFDGTSFKSGEHWMIAARTVAGTVEWPRAAGLPLFQEPHGPRRRYAPLAVVDLQEYGTWSKPRDCRRRFPPLSGLVNFFYVGGGGQEAMPDLTAVDPHYVELNQPLQVGVSNWRWPVAGARVRFQVVVGGGKLNGTNDDDVTVLTNADGIASCRWSMKGGKPAAAGTQQVQATLLDEDDQQMQTPVVFDANLSVASEVAYNGEGCSTLEDQRTVQAAVTRLSRLTRITPVSPTGMDVPPWQAGEASLGVTALVSNDCGPVDGARVRFTASHGEITPAIVLTKAGLATTDWTLADVAPTQQVTAVLEDAGPGNVTHLPEKLVFVANRNVASNTAYIPPRDCSVLSAADTVQEAIDMLALLPRLFQVTGAETHASVDEDVPLVVGVVSDCGPDTTARMVRYAVVMGNGTLLDTDQEGRVLTSDGQATCRYRMGDERRHVIEVQLIREDRETYQPPVFFTVTRIEAAHVTYRPECDLLRTVENVQDAITALCKRLDDPKGPVLALGLEPAMLTTVEDGAGLWIFEGGQVFGEGELSGHYTSHVRTLFEIPETEGVAMLTMTMIFEGEESQENLTLQGAHSFLADGATGSVSAASAGLARFIGRNFIRESGNRIIIGETGQ